MAKVRQSEIYERRRFVEQQVNLAAGSELNPLSTNCLGVAEALLNISRIDILKNRNSLEELSNSFPFGLDGFASWFDCPSEVNEALHLMELPPLESFDPIEWFDIWPQSVRLLSSDALIRKVVEVVSQRWGLNVQSEHLRSKRSLLERIFGASCVSLSNKDCVRWMEIICSETNLSWLRQRFIQGWHNLTLDESIRMQAKDLTLSKTKTALLQLTGAHLVISSNETELFLRATAALSAIEAAREEPLKSQLIFEADESVMNCRFALNGHLNDIVDRFYLDRSARSISFREAKSRLEGGFDLGDVINALPLLTDEERDRMRPSNWIHVAGDEPPVWLWADAFARKEIESRDTFIWQSSLNNLPGPFSVHLQRASVNVTPRTMIELRDALRMLGLNLDKAKLLAFREISPKEWYRDLADLLQELSLVVPCNSAAGTSAEEEPMLERILFIKLNEAIHEFEALQSYASVVDESIAKLKSRLSQEIQAADFNDNDSEKLRETLNNLLDTNSYLELGTTLKRLRRVRSLQQWRREYIEGWGPPTLIEMIPWCRLAFRNQELPENVELLARFVHRTNSYCTLVVTEAQLSEAERICDCLQSSITSGGQTGSQFHQLIDPLAFGLIYAFDDIRKSMDHEFQDTSITTDLLPKVIEWWNDYDEDIIHERPVPETVRNFITRFPRYRSELQ